MPLLTKASNLRRPWAGSLLVVALGVLSGCRTTYDVVVDATSYRSKPVGTFYRLAVHDPTGGVDQQLAARAVALIREALRARGLWEAPSGVRPELVIEAEYGVGPDRVKLERTLPVTFNGDKSVLVLAGKPSVKAIVVFEKYLFLSAREPVPEDASPARGREARAGAELWNLRVSIVDEKQQLEPYLPVLASVSGDYIGENSDKAIHVMVTAGEAAKALRRREAQRQPAR